MPESLPKRVLNFLLITEHFFTAEVKVVIADAQVAITFLVLKFTCTVTFWTDQDVLHDKFSLNAVFALALVPLGATFVAHLLLAGFTLRVASIEPTLWFRNHSVAVRFAAPFHISHFGKSYSCLLSTIYVPS